MNTNTTWGVFYGFVISGIAAWILFPKQNQKQIMTMVAGGVAGGIVGSVSAPSQSVVTSSS